MVDSENLIIQLFQKKLKKLSILLKMDLLKVRQLFGVVIMEIIKLLPLFRKMGTTLSSVDNMGLIWLFKMIKMELNYICQSSQLTNLSLGLTKRSQVQNYILFTHSVERFLICSKATSTTVLKWSSGAIMVAATRCGSWTTLKI